MTDRTPQPAVAPATARRWTAPALTRLDAAQAQIGTRSAITDGGFSTS